MDLFEDPTFKTKYQKNKLCVKLWESDFMEKYGRKPNKNDIRDADVTIKEAYKMYWKLKTRALEETLTDITFCEDVQSNVSNKSPRKTINDQKQDKSPSPEKLTGDTENIDPHNSKCSMEIDGVFDQSVAANIEGVWGNHLNKSKEQATKKKQTLIGRSSSFQLSRNKFESSMFTKRNPRKSVSSTKIKNKFEKSMLNNSTREQGDLDNKNNFNEVEETQPIFRESLKVTFEENKSSLHSVNAVQQLVDGHVIGVNRNLNQGWLDRCAKDSNLEVSTSIIRPGSQQRHSGTSDSGIESMESSIYSPKDTVPIAQSVTSPRISDEEDFIRNSDSEEERRNKRIRNFKKQLNDQDDRVAKRPCIDRIDSKSITGGSVNQSILDGTTNILEILKLTPNDDTSFNLMDGCNRTKSDNIESCKLTRDVNPNFDLLDKSIKIQNDKIPLVSDVESNVAGNDIIRNTFQNQNEQIGSNTGTTNKMPKLVDLANQDASVPARKITSCSSRRKLKRVLSDDSDPDCVEKDQRKRKTALKEKKDTARTRSVKRSTNRNKIKTLNADGKSDVKKKLKNDEENDDSNLEMRKIEMYGVEMLQTVSRFAMKSTGTGDLIAQFSESISTDQSEKDTPISTGETAELTKKKKLEKKIATGTLNNNFVRINLKKKVFVRGKKNFNLSKYKKNQWKQRKKDLASSESNLYVADLIDKNGMVCFKCGESGHFAKNCSASKGDALLPLEEIDESSNFPTLAEAEKMANGNAVVAHSHKIEKLPERSSCSFTVLHSPNEEEAIAQLFNDDFPDHAEKNTRTFGHKIPQELLSRLLPPQKIVNPLYPINKDESLIETPKEVFETLRMFGHENFRNGQEKAVMRILSGQSTLVTMSTGSGKSLCYQLPAYLYSQRSNCITLVISPLVSLMDDQVTDMPLFLSAACLHTSQSPKVRDHVMQRVKDGKVNILLISPEAIVAGEKSTGFGALLRQLPPIAFVCIDEAHCISQWSHNFRPSYLMVCRVIKEKFGVRTVLGLTATATKMTKESIIKHLELHDGMAGVISDMPVPRNLFLTISKEQNKDKALINLLRSERFQEYDSIIVYCTRREECARIAGLLRTSLQDMRKPEKSNVKVSSIAEAYHAGMTAHRRKVVQKEFMNGRIKIVIATVAFGMGINKSDIRSVIHYNMPGTFEAFVQEVGRAGRDGHTAHCHLFLNPMHNTDKWELRRHIHANGVDRHTIRHLLQRIFIQCSCAKTNERNSSRRCPGHEVALPIDETVQALDITEEMISTLLCYLELHPKRFITVLSSVYVRARVSSYGGPQALKRAAQSSPPLAMAIALDMQKGISHETTNIIEFPIIDVASAIGWDSGVVKSHLKNLEWTVEAGGKMKRSAISVRYDKLGFRVKAPGDLTDTELDEALDALIMRTQSQESSCLQQLEIISSTLDKISMPSIKNCSVLDSEVTEKSEELKQIIRKYFRSDSPLNSINISHQDKAANEPQIASDVRSLVMCYRDTKFTGRAVARIFHGIQSPNYPAVIWGRCRFWRAHLCSDFDIICKIATKEILALR